MKLIGLFLVVCVACLAECSAERPARIPSIFDMFGLQKEPTNAGRPRLSPSELEKMVRKGEYVCGDKICRLKPGEKPKNCPMCQYPLGFPLKKPL